MSIYRCVLCKKPLGPFFIWSTSRYFPRGKLAKLLKKKKIQYAPADIYLHGVPVCYLCARELGCKV